MAFSFGGQRLAVGLRAVYAGVAAVDVVLSGSASHSAHRARRFTKPLLMPLLAASLASDPGARRSPLLRTTLAGQLAGWGGDVALLGDGPRDFARGATSFAAGHAAYICGLLPYRAGGPGRGAKAIAGVWAASAPGVALAAGREASYLAPVLLGYSAALASTAASATMLGAGIPAPARRRLVAGGLAFLVSDAVLGLRRFLWRGAPPVAEAVVMATYATAQYLIAGGAARAAVWSDA
ncbi:lysoplasmalogenase [Segniliparus rugosus]|uniref:Lysoplasmalogenase n=1 Tax=Segniliparus rugosus (strain ATCC BAA-974 / DSM 45345 / CCUG 50838 / CIP 108380 / JCM 13579 / CDC 945) TaxID=679197 RepID=E5XP13_SEGRC|nr:lysoplasmalogenase [Segniliparus rugosus]EFV13905.1 hypothetical protein HMPREF9336_01234 [Segniliparus rugosus ATCC BAA-974]